MFAIYKRKSDIPLSTTSDTKQICNWKRMQTDFDAGKLKIYCNYCTRKKCALDALHTTESYQTMTSAEKEYNNAKVTAKSEAHRDIDFKVAAEQWKALNCILDNHLNNHLDDNSNDLYWNFRDENKLDVSNPDYEVDESIAAQKGAPYELNAEREVKLNEETTAGLKYILKKARQGHEISSHV